MYVFMIIAVILVCVVALIGTLLVGKEVSTKQKQYEVEGDSLKDEIARSHEYETKSLKTNVKSLTWIYIGLTVLVVATSIGIMIFF
ncbi:hypothetical protein [Lederbergia ruris]|uniref:Uncharacterized protein n=1 Tax=Lederbergia ruris TaxID=217495 RepID=A0ABQ4KKA4_9BACI|nr:hypothetical protein [Lederbergia ruris]GIN57752.1 hypothetical protein J8TS2_20710 [Lederbergia ruris]